MIFHTSFKSFLSEQQSNLNTNFWKWFGNSKVLNFEKEPLIVYHGTNTEFNVFDAAKININEPHGDYIVFGFYFNPDKNKATRYIKGNNKIIMSVYLRIENPLFIYSTKDGVELRNSFGGDEQYFSIMDDEPEEIKNELIKRGYDGLIDYSYHQYAVFNPNQIKSVDNDGSWDLNDDNILS